MSGNIGTVYLQGFPQMPTVFVDPTTGRLTPVAYRLLLSLWHRTGGANGTNTDGLAGLATMPDVPDAPTLNAGALLLRSFSDVPDITPAQATALLLSAMTADMPPPGLNPITAAQLAEQPTPQTVAHPAMWALATTIET